jgi:catechol 2,3-dioxygenase
MSSFSIHPETKIGHIALTVADLARSLSFYEDVLGFAVERREAEVALRAGSGKPLILLAELPGARPKPQHTTGLYHYAIRLPDRPSLALILQQLQQTGYGLQGASDHGVSEALYLADPDGNGIEIYRDRPRDAWPLQDGTLEMGTAPLDMDDLLATPGAASSDWKGAPEGTDIGHMHLHVADLDAARRFYCDGLGFTLMQRYGNSALFVSAGGYHHHIGLNTWAGAGAPPPPDDAVGLTRGCSGLRYFALRLPDTSALDALIAHCAEVGIATTDTPEGVRVADPSGNTVLLTTAT